MPILSQNKLFTSEGGNLKIVKGDFESLISESEKRKRKILIAH